MIALRNTSKEYSDALRIAERLHDMLDDRKPSVVSKEAMLNAATNLAGIFMIIRYEQFNPLVSKALGFVFRVR